MFMWLLADWALNYMWRGNLIHLSFGLWRCIWPCCPEEMLIKLFYLRITVDSINFALELLCYRSADMCWPQSAVWNAMVQCVVVWNWIFLFCVSWQCNVTFFERVLKWTVYLFKDLKHWVVQLNSTILLWFKDKIQKICGYLALML